MSTDPRIQAVTSALYRACLGNGNTLPYAVDLPEGATRREIRHAEREAERLNMEALEFLAQAAVTAVDSFEGPPTAAPVVMPPRPHGVPNTDLQGIPLGDTAGVPITMRYVKDHP